ncbi:hypothetical protein Q5P01_008292 [Channa striata]|uniref:Uncharacterized protein n=1 Tax=Channa striata TaxID=64152 RepID=A0AA88NDU7_CHASR|nr:hypothetical protein Q5P01_008292 [Channa striata]
MIADFKSRWPALFTAKEIDKKFMRISTVPLLSTFFAELDRYSPQLMEIFRCKGGLAGRKTRAVMLTISKDDYVHTRRASILKCLCAYPYKDHENLVKEYSKPFEIPPGRQIVSDCGSETYLTAEFLDFYLNPLSTTHPSYIKDTYDFVEKVRKLHVPREAMLFTMDVDSLYTNIHTGEGIQAIQNNLQQNPDKKRPDMEFLQLSEINLTRNT